MRWKIRLEWRVSIAYGNNTSDFYSNKVPIIVMSDLEGSQRGFNWRMEEYRLLIQRYSEFLIEQAAEEGQSISFHDSAVMKLQGRIHSMYYFFVISAI